MSFLQKLCGVYDAVMGTSGTEGEAPLLPMWMVQRDIAINIILSPSGAFVAAQRLNEQSFAVPSTPQAESRSSDATPFPLADSLKYLMSGKHGGYLDAYLAQLAAWCAAPHAPDCLRMLLTYLQKGTLYDDLAADSGFKLQYSKDASRIACFSIEYADEEQRPWMREDVQSSWRMQFQLLLAETETALCCITGQRLPLMKKHPYLQGTSRLISAKDDAFPMQYKGRFVEDGSAATISIEASEKVHRALRWLLAHQRFQKYGMSFVGWNTRAPQLLSSADEDEEDEKPAPDTLQGYVNALFESVQGRTDAYLRAAENTTAEAHKRREAIVLLGLQSATQGRVSVSYVQEMPGNVFVKHVEAWNQGCFWRMMPMKQLPQERTVTWNEICTATMGEKDVQTANRDYKAEKSVTKYMRDLQLRLLHCAVEAQPIPESMVKAAFSRAVQPLIFTDGKGNWLEWQWMDCVAAACGMIRKLHIDRQPARPLTPTLDVTCTDRDYLYGRLFAIAHRIEQAAGSAKTSAVRLMTMFVQRPEETWVQLYKKLLPHLQSLGKDGHTARYYQHLMAQAEGLFTPETRHQPLSYLFLVGFSTQTNELWRKQEEKQSQAPITGFHPPKTRDELYGCLLAVADYAEWQAEALTEAGRIISRRDGRTNAIQLTDAFISRPMTTWANIHARLIPYLEKQGVRMADFVQTLLRKIEQSFAVDERLSDAPLGCGFLHGYLLMLDALGHRGGLDMRAWMPIRRMEAALPPNREAAYGALLALENQTERRILDLEKPEDENRPSNAMRFLTRAAQRPDEVWAYLQERMKPYASKQRFSQEALQRAAELRAWIAQNQWNQDKPLGGAYLHYFYLYNQLPGRKDEKST